MVVAVIDRNKMGEKPSKFDTRPTVGQSKNNPKYRVILSSPSHLPVSSKRMKYKAKTKKKRRQWWNRLTPEQQEKQIIKWQAQKAKSHKLLPDKILKYNPEYPWMTEGVNDTNRAEWWAMINKKNPWLKVA